VIRPSPQKNSADGGSDHSASTPAAAEEPMHRRRDLLVRPLEREAVEGCSATASANWEGDETTILSTIARSLPRTRLRSG